jgi:hypothetical protein
MKKLGFEPQSWYFFVNFQNNTSSCHNYKQSCFFWIHWIANTSSWSNLVMNPKIAVLLLIVFYRGVCELSRFYPNSLPNSIKVKWVEMDLKPVFCILNTNRPNPVVSRLSWVDFIQIHYLIRSKLSGWVGPKAWILYVKHELTQPGGEWVELSWINSSYI